jgi:hypothetical protein
MMRTRLHSAVLPFLPGGSIVLVLATIFWFPALAWHRTVIHGDIPGLSIPHLDFLARAVRGLVSVSWSDQLNGGHPFFAEGQIGFAQPLSLLWAAVVTPLVGAITSVNLFNWMMMNVAAVGIIGLCRSLGAGPWASAFAALAIVFSGAWTHAQYALPVFETLACIPWCLWAFEAWLARPSLRSAIVLGSVGALVFLSGYPQGLYGTLIFGLSSLLIVPLDADSRREWTKSWRARLGLGVVACAVCVGLAAVQLLPLLELVELSQRSGGVAPLFHTALPAYLRGQLFTSEIHELPNAIFYTKLGIGSVLVCVLASFVLISGAPSRVIGHLIAALVLLQLGAETGSPFFRFMYEHDLLPGLHYFRIMQIYLAISTIGFGIAAAFAVDGIGRWAARSRNIWSLLQPLQQFSSTTGFLIMTAFWTFWISALWLLEADRFPSLHIWVLLAGVAAAALMILWQKPTWVAPVFVLLLTVECVGLRIHPFRFYDQDILATSPAVAAIKAIPDWRQYKFMTTSLSSVAVFTSPLSPQLPAQMRRMMAAIMPMTHLASNIASIDAHVSLSLRRRVESQALLNDDAFGRSAAAAGHRLLDVLAVRFLTMDWPVNTAGFRLLHFNERDMIWTMENTAARPRFQIYTRHQLVDSLDEALTAVRNMQPDSLIVEKLEGYTTPDVSGGDDGSGDDSATPRLQVLTAMSTRYAFKTSAVRPVWLFVADANYPGWTASIDGRDVPVLSAQILGKAVAVPPGDHVVTIQFRSLSLLLGLGISGFTLIAVALMLMYRRSPRPPTAGLNNPHC